MSIAKKKVAIVGDCESGKTYLWRGYFESHFADVYVPTVLDGNEIFLKNVTLDLWDTSGQEDYDRLRPLAYQDADVVIVCYSIDRPDLLIKVIDKWMLEVRFFCGMVPVILVGNKKDLRDDFVSTWAGLATIAPITDGGDVYPYPDSSPVPNVGCKMKSIWSPWKGKKSASKPEDVDNDKNLDLRSSYTTDQIACRTKKSVKRRRRSKKLAKKSIGLAETTTDGDGECTIDQIIEGVNKLCLDDTDDCLEGKTSDSESSLRPDVKQGQLALVENGENSPMVYPEYKPFAADPNASPMKKWSRNRWSGKRRSKKSKELASFKCSDYEVQPDVENIENMDPEKSSAASRMQSVWSPWNGIDWPNKFLDLTFLDSSNYGICSGVENDEILDPEMAAAENENVTRKQIVSRVAKQLMLSTRNGQKMANKIEAFAFFECSAKTQEGVEELFSTVVKAAKIKHKKRKVSRKYFRQ